MRIVAAIAGFLLLGSPALSQGVEQPIPNAAGWALTAVPQSGCFARRAGAQVDTTLAIGRDGKLVLGAGHPEWNIPSGDKPVTLRVDGGAPHAFEASPVGNLIFVLIDDNGLTNQIRQAHQLGWTLGPNAYSAEVGGLGVALDAVRACNAKAP